MLWHTTIEDSLYSKKGDYENAIRDLEKAFRLDPTQQKHNFLMLAMKHTINRGIAHDEGGEYDKAVDSYSKVISLNPDDAHAYGRRGIAYGNVSDFDRAIDDLEKIVALGYTLGEVHLEALAISYYNRGLVA